MRFCYCSWDGSVLDLLTDILFASVSLSSLILELCSPFNVSDFVSFYLLLPLLLTALELLSPVSAGISVVVSLILSVVSML